jgi:hypothetical protein
VTERRYVLRSHGEYLSYAFVVRHGWSSRQRDAVRFSKADAERVSRLRRVFRASTEVVGSSGCHEPFEVVRLRTSREIVQRAFDRAAKQFQAPWS